MNKFYALLGLLHHDQDGRIDWARTCVYDDLNPWGIYSVRKGLIRAHDPKKVFLKLKKMFKQIKTDKGDELFVSIDLSQEGRSFTVIPNYRAIRHSCRIVVSDRSFPVREFIDFKPHYSLHDPEGIFVISSVSSKNRAYCESEVSSLDIFPTMLSLLGVDYRDKNVTGRVRAGIKGGMKDENRAVVGCTRRSQ